MAKVLRVTPKCYYEVEIDTENEMDNFCFNVSVGADGKLYPVEEGDWLIMHSMKNEDSELTKKLFSDIKKQIKL